MAGVQGDTMRSNASTRSGKKSKAQNSPAAAAGGGKGRTGVCSVRLLDGTTYEVAVDKNALGEELFKQVCSYIDIIESDYFGITYRDAQDIKFWLNSEKKISKQLGSQSWNFNFEVKFYPPDPTNLQEDITRYQLCLQIRHDILSTKLPCSFITHALLGSYTVQAELGDWTPNDHGFTSAYISNFHFAPEESNELLDKIAELHRHHKGQTPSEAELHFLDNAKKLAMYGIDLHSAKDSDGVDIKIGVCASGLVVYREQLRINRFAWPKIIKISYKRHNFYVKLRPGEFEKFESTVVFKLANHKMAKRLWKTAVESHTFFRLKEAEAAKKGAVFFPKFGNRFRYSGRTQWQTKHHTQAVDRQEPLFERAASKRGISGNRDSQGRDGHGEDGYRNGGDSDDQMEGVDEDGRSWYRDAQGRKVYKTTTTTTTTTRYIIDGETEDERAAREAREAEEQREREIREQELRRQQMEEQQRMRELEAQRAAEEERMREEERLRQQQMVREPAPRGLHNADHSEKHVPASLQIDDTDYERELVEAILSLTGMSEDIVVEKIQLQTVNNSA